MYNKFSFKMSKQFIWRAGGGRVWFISAKKSTKNNLGLHFFVTIEDMIAFQVYQLRPNSHFSIGRSIEQMHQLKIRMKNVFLNFLKLGFQHQNSKLHGWKNFSRFQTSVESSNPYKFWFSSPQDPGIE